MKLKIRFQFLHNRYGQDIPVWDILDNNGKIVTTCLTLRQAFNYLRKYSK